MASIVIVHGAWGGGWEWEDVADRLRRRRHGVLTPTLSDLVTDEVVDLLEAEDLDGVVLCGASFGAMPVTGAADRVPERVAAVVYVDGLVPTDGQCGLDLLPEWFGDLVRRGVVAEGPAWAVPMPDDLVAALELTDHADRLRPQPVRTFLEPVRLSDAGAAIPRAFVRCTGWAPDARRHDPIEPIAARARAEGWAYRELSLPHDPQLADAAATADVLDELAGLSPRAGARSG